MLVFFFLVFRYTIVEWRPTSWLQVCLSVLIFMKTTFNFKKDCQVANIAANRWLLKIKTKYFHFWYGMALYFFGK